MPLIQVFLLRFRWWLWNLLADHGPDPLWAFANKICPTDKELDFLDSLDARKK